MNTQKPFTAKSLAELFLRILRNGCVFATLITLLFFAIAAIITINKDSSERGLNFMSYFIVVIFSMLIAAANEVLHIRSIPYFLRLLIHYTVLILSFFAVFVGSDQLVLERGIPAIIVWIFLFTIVYAVFVGIYHLVLLLVRRATARGERARDEDDDF